MDDSRNAARYVTPTTKGKSLAQKRLGKILDGDQLAIIVTNRQARVGMKPKGISRQPDWLETRVVQLIPADRLLSRSRRPPHRTR